MGKKKTKDKSAAGLGNFSDASVQLFHPAHDGQYATSFLILNVGDTSIAFNCGEGFQRMCGESRAKPSRLTAVLLTRTRFQTCTGLPGAVITCAEAAKSSCGSLHVAGPHGVGRFMNALAAYSEYVLAELSLTVQELEGKSRAGSFYVMPEPVYETPQLKCKAILLLLPGGSSAAQEGGSAEAAEPPAKRQRSDGANPKGASVADGDVGGFCLEHVAVYVCVMADKRGKFLPAKAKDLGVKPGPDFGKLTNGEAVTTASGAVVQPEQCMEDGSKGECIIVIDCPSTALLPALQAALPAVLEATEDPSQQRLTSVFHLSPAALQQAPEYLGILSKLAHCINFTAESRFDPAQHAPALKSAVQLQLKLHLLCPFMFPAPAMLDADRVRSARAQVATTTPPDPDAAQAGSAVEAGESNGGVKAAAAEAESRASTTRPLPAAGGPMQRLVHLSKVVLRPLRFRGVDVAELHQPLDPGRVADELCTECMDAVSASHDADGSGLAGVDEREVPQDGFRVVLLGTGAACPSVYRNVTAIYLDFFSKGGMLLDCGEGTLSQFIRRFGVEDAMERIKGLKAVWLSHRHADHHVGLPFLLATRRQLLPNSPTIPLFGPFPLRKVLSACSKIEDLNFAWHDQYSICPREQGAGRDLDFFWNRLSGVDVSPTVNAVSKELGLDSFASILVQHCKHAFGFVMTTAAGRKFVFSGDTQKCGNLIQEAQKASILVHEATFEDHMRHDADYKKHSTTSDALAVARESQCEALVMTHFSQRYPKSAVLQDAYHGPTAMAFDMMTVDSNCLQSSSAVLRVLQGLFSDEAAPNHEAARE